MAAVAAAIPSHRAISPFLISQAAMASAFLHCSPVAAQAGRWFQPKLPTLSAALPAISLNLPRLLEGLWEGILKAVPKKKTSYSKKRSRQNAGKALEDVTGLCKCPACGRVKRMHFLCSYCMKKIVQMWKTEDAKERSAKKVKAEKTAAKPAGRLGAGEATRLPTKESSRTHPPPPR